MKTKGNGTATTTATGQKSIDEQNHLQSSYIFAPPAGLKTGRTINGKDRSL